MISFLNEGKNERFRRTSFHACTEHVRGLGVVGIGQNFAIRKLFRTKVTIAFYIFPENTLAPGCYSFIFPHPFRPSLPMAGPGLYTVFCTNNLDEKCREACFLPGEHRLINRAANLQLNKNYTYNLIPAGPLP